MAGKGHPHLATSDYPLAPESRRSSRQDQTYHPPPRPCTMGLTSISQETRVFPLEPPHGLHSHSCGLPCPLGRQYPKVGTAGRIPAGARYVYIGDSSRKLSFPDTSRTHVAPKPEFCRNTHPCSWQGSSSPSNFPLPTSSRKSTFVQARPNLPPIPSPMHNGLTSISQETRVFPLEPSHGLHSHSCGLQCQLGRQLPKAGTAGRIPACAGYPYIGDSSRKLSFPDTFRTPVAPKPEFSQNTHPCGWQGSSSPSNFPLPTSSQKSTFVQARPNLPPTPSPMHNGLTSNSQETRVFPLEPPHGLHSHSCGLQCPLGSPTPESGHSRENISRSRVPLYRRFQQESIVSRHFSYPRSS